MDGSYIVVPFGRFSPCGTNRRMMADLFDEEAVALVRPTVLVCFAQQWVKRFGNAANGRCILARRKRCDVQHPLSRVRAVCRNIEEVGILHVLGHTVQQGCWLVESHRQCHLRHVFANHGLQYALVES